MNAKDDLAASLPDPPPPAPNRREVAIDEAMRRFDGETFVPSRAGVQQGGAGSWLRRPQVGALVSVGLIALIGLPAAWMMANHQNEVYRQVRPTPRYDISPRSSDAVVNTVQPSPMIAASPPGTVSPPADVARAMAPPRAAGPAPAATLAVRAATVAAPPPAPRELAQSDVVASEPNKPVESRYRAQSRDSAFASASPSPPPAMIIAAPVAPAPAPATAVASAIPQDEVVVTGARRARPWIGRGDWNACTVNDPSQNLDVCRRRIDSSAPGPKGVAAAHLVDGLTQAWRGDMSGAIATFDQAIAIAPTLSAGYLNRSQAYARSGDDEQALADANKAVRYAPNSAQARYNRSVILRRTGATVQAEKDEERAIEIDPSYATAVPQ